MLKANLQSLNPKFQIEVRSVDWPTYLKDTIRGNLPLFIIGWMADYPDPHNFVFPFMHSQGTFSGWQNYANSEVDSLIDQGILEVESAERRQINYSLQELYYEDVPSVTIVQPLGRHWERDWLNGWYYNPVFPDIGYFYTLWKGYE